MQQILASRLFSSRRGTALLGLAAAVLAGIVLFVYLSSYQSSVQSSTAPVTVLVARNLIEKGTSGNDIATQKLYQATDIKKTELKIGAITDASTLRGRVAAADIYPGQQFTAADFSENAIDSLPVALTGDDRGISLTLDASHGITGPLAAGNHVDVWQAGDTETGTGMKLLVADVTVLSAPATPTGGGGANVVLELKWWQVPRVASGYDAGGLWLILRPQSGATATKPPTANTAGLYQSTKGG
jgi:Flp pilus assembly protein CpaB